MISKSFVAQIEPDRFQAWQAGLIHRPAMFKPRNSAEALADQEAVAVEQNRLTDAASEGAASLTDYLIESLGFDPSTLAENVPSLPEQITPAEMKSLPCAIESAVYESFRSAELPISVAVDSRFWTMCHAKWISERSFGNDLLPALFEGGGDTNERRVRNFLRRTGGLILVRGYVSPFVDCLLAAAWWRCRLAQEAHQAAADEGFDLAFEAAHEVLHETAVWPNLVGLSVKRITSINAPRARAAFIAATHACMLERSSKLKVGEIQGALRALGRLSNDYSLWYVPWQKLVETASSGIESGAVDTDGETEADEDEADDE